MSEQFLFNIAVDFLIYLTLGLIVDAMVMIYDHSSWFLDVLDKNFDKSFWMVALLCLFWLLLWPIVVFIRKKR